MTVSAATQDSRILTRKKMRTDVNTKKQLVSNKKGAKRREYGGEDGGGSDREVLLKRDRDASSEAGDQEDPP